MDTPGAAIQAVIFDYGGVILDMRWPTARALAIEHGLEERALPESLYGSDAWRALEIGSGDRERWLRESHEELERLAGRPLPPLHEHWRADQRLIAENVDLIRRLRPTFRTQVLSNADRTLQHRLRETYRIADLFDDIVCSAEVGMAKPDPAIYALAAERLKLQPAECVFIDDMERNVDAARSSGMQAILFTVDAGHVLESQLAELGVSARP